MPAHLVKAVLALASTAGLTLATAPAHADQGPVDASVWKQLAPTVSATAKYRHIPFALAAGYKPNPCTMDMNGGKGAMGYHYINPRLYGSLDPVKPAALLYEDDGKGGRTLTGVEWIVKADKNTARPTMFGRKFEGPVTAHHNSTIPAHYSLHAWLYKKNPSGLFYEWNPEVKCPYPGAPG
ncbi:hypothetical protein [Streptomyces misionensis]|uniref:hypothetical protein n=1 Tax=Streptomyces misionensis TaxID=67331 RepID=UPI00396BEFC5